MKDTNTYLLQIPPVSREYAESLSRRFPAKAVSTTMTLAEIHDHAGEQRVISLILREASGSKVLNSESDTREVIENKIENKSFWNRVIYSLGKSK